jgi:hypothetical protein
MNKKRQNPVEGLRSIYGQAILVSDTGEGTAQLFCNAVKTDYLATGKLYFNCSLFCKRVLAAYNTKLKEKGKFKLIVFF